ncbi:MAG: 3-(2,3-dihydroxyphenyl)propionate dioxygenase [Pusillimonas sp.]|nr:3-(2,3-dihydroxyphenyl)propionate dioxygenase [Pusillimonas sp.]
MTALLQCLSHSPLIGRVDPAQPILQDVRETVNKARERIAAFNPELILIFAPDHYNGFYYDIMPPFCIGTQAYAIGDYGSAEGFLSVPAETAEAAATFALEAGIDVALSHKMTVDHGFAQPLDFLLGGLNTVPVIPVFINSVAVPLPSFHRARLLGNVLGQYVCSLGKRVLIIGSGGLSHQPPVPEFATADQAVKERLLGGGRHLSAQQRQARTEQVINVARQFSQNQNILHPLNTEWDHWFLNIIASGKLTELDDIPNETVSSKAGKSAHEVKNWVAAAAAMAAFGHYSEVTHYYHAIPEWIAGYGAFTAIQA